MLPSATPARVVIPEGHNEKVIRARLSDAKFFWEQDKKKPLDEMAAAGMKMKEAGLTPPTTTTKSFSVMGKTFDPARPEEYLNSFKIRKAS